MLFGGPIASTYARFDGSPRSRSPFAARKARTASTVDCAGAKRARTSAGDKKCRYCELFGFETARAVASMPAVLRFRKYTRTTMSSLPTSWTRLAAVAHRARDRAIGDRPLAAPAPAAVTVPAA